MSLYHLTTTPRYDRAEAKTYHLTPQNTGDIISQFDSFILHASIELAQATVKDYRYKLKAFIGYCLDNYIRNIEKITTDHIRGFIAWWQQTHSLRTVHDYYKVTRRFFSWLVEEGRLDHNPMVKVRAPRVPQNIIKVFTAEHIRDILLLCEDGTRTGVRNRAMIITLLDTGIRLSELVRIQVNDIDIQRGIITIMGKGARQRVVGISRSAIRAIINYYEQRPGECPQLWLTEEGNPITSDGVSQIFKALKRRAGFSDVRLSAHTFRHTSGTMALLNGASEREVQLLLGHSTNRMTQHYTATINSQNVVARHKDFSPVDRLGIK
jgi:integrase/recombinase XerC